MTTTTHPLDDLVTELRNESRRVQSRIEGNPSDLPYWEGYRAAVDRIAGRLDYVLRHLDG